MAVITRVRFTAKAFFFFSFGDLMLLLLLLSVAVSFSVSDIQSFDQFVQFYGKQYKDEEYAFPSILVTQM